MSLEQEALSEGFRICLLGVRLARAEGEVEFAARLYAGGRRMAEIHHQTGLFHPAERALANLRRMVAAVTAPPHLLVVHGTGWAELLAQAIPTFAREELWVLELLPTAVALHGGLRPRAGVDAIRRAFGLGPAPDGESPASAVYEDLLWAVIAEAGRRGLGWTELLQVAEQSRARPPFERYAFTAATLAKVPAAPGVYVMFDAEGHPLYVGKSANLARRLQEYFRPTRVLSDKLAKLRERVHDLDYELVGSELEALLVEQKRIKAAPELMNVQRSVAEGTSRYAFPLTPLVLVCPSVRRGQVELFWCGVEAHALQVRMAPGRWPRRRLAALAEHYARHRRAPAAMRGVVDWGPEGNEVCCRYFRRHPERLTWLELDLSHGTAAWVQTLGRAAQAVAVAPQEAAAVRWTSEADSVTGS